MGNGIASTSVPSSTPRADAGGAGTLLLSRGDVERLLTPDECIAAVEDAFRQHALGADNENKQELDPLLLAHSKLVTDLTEQCSAIGDLHHALAAGVMSRAEVHAELGEIIAGHKPGRTSDDEIIVFDSTGTALQDVAAAAAVYRRAKDGESTRFSFNA